MHAPHPSDIQRIAKSSSSHNAGSEWEADASQGKQRTHVIQPHLEDLQHALLDDERLVIEFFNDEVVLLAVDLHNDGFDGRVAFDEHACGRGVGY